MRRLLRWTFNTLAIASLLLCLATAGLWVRSYCGVDQLVAAREGAPEDGRRHGTPQRAYVVQSYSGQLTGWLFWSERPEANATSSWEFEFDQSNYPFVDLWTLRYGLSSQGVGLPDWQIFSTFAVLPAIFAFRQVRAVRRRRRRSRLGCCPACGYDLRASPERCPECGRMTG